MEQRLSMRWKNLTKWYTVMRNSNVWMCAEVNDSRKGKHWLSNSRAVTSLILSCFRCRAPPSHTEKAVWFLLTNRENQSVSLGNKWNGPSSTCCLSGLSFFSPLKMHLFFTSCVWVFCEHVCEWTIAGVSGAHRSPKKVLGSPGTGFRVCCKSSCGF